MTKRKLITIAVAISILASIACLLWPQPEIHGDLSRHDVHEVCRIVLSDLRKSHPLVDEPTPGQNRWDVVTFLPSTIRARLATRILSIAPSVDGTVEVTIGGKEGVAVQATYQLKKIDTGWDIGEAASMGPAMEPSWEWPEFRKMFFAQRF